MQLKEKIGLDTIHHLERHFLDKFLARFCQDDRISIYGPKDPEKRINILPFNIKHRDRILHPKFVTTLLSDLFGIQTRAGCSCAGPYGHYVLSIDEEFSKGLTCYLDRKKNYGLKPGWVRLNMHYALSEYEADYIMDAIEFVIKHGSKFLDKYMFNFCDGSWKHTGSTVVKHEINLDFDQVMKQPPKHQQSHLSEQLLYQENLEKAEQAVKELPKKAELKKHDNDVEKFMFFYCTHSENL
jgi:hypothetical protein